MNELRRDYFTDTWVVIATDRARKPTDYVKVKTPVEHIKCDCAFCPGCEHLTPPSKASYYARDTGTVIEADVDGTPPGTGWMSRVIPNMYPAVRQEVPAGFEGRPAIGIHEVIVESPEHTRHPQFMSDKELKLLFSIYRDRFREASAVPYIEYVSVFRNYGRDAGASQSHPHSQLIALPITPSAIKDQYDKNYEDVLHAEERSPRLISGTEHTIAFTPYASIAPYEVRIFPRKPCRNIAEMTDEERDDMACMTGDILARMSRILNDPPYNYGFVQSLSRPLHMHLRIVPKLGIEAGFELNTGMHINSVPPEEACKNLRNA